MSKSAVTFGGLGSPPYVTNSDRRTSKSGSPLPDAVAGGVRLSASIAETSTSCSDAVRHGVPVLRHFSFTPWTIFMLIGMFRVPIVMVKSMFCTPDMLISRPFATEK